jgi:hypothetical protein
LRLVTTGSEQDERRYVDLIHETLIRARSQGSERSGQRDRLLADAVRLHREEPRSRHASAAASFLRPSSWRGASGSLGRLRGTLPVGTTSARYRRLRIDLLGAEERRFVLWSRWSGAMKLVVLLGVFGSVGEGVWWASRNNLPFDYAVQKPLWFLRSLAGHPLLPEMVDIPPGSFTMGCLAGRDDVEGATCGKDDVAHQVTLSRPFALGRYELTFREYDYYVWACPVCCAAGPGTTFRTAVALPTASTTRPDDRTTSSAFGCVVVPPSIRGTPPRWALKRRAADHWAARSAARGFFGRFQLLSQAKFDGAEVAEEEAFIDAHEPSSLARREEIGLREALRAWQSKKVVVLTVPRQYL